jgi:hypothetical protein
MAGIRPDLDGSNHLSGRIQSKLSESGRIWSKWLGSGRTCSSESGNDNRTLPDSSDSRQTLIFVFRNFFRASQTLKNIFEKIIFSENDFAENILR